MKKLDVFFELGTAYMFNKGLDGQEKQKLFELLQDKNCAELDKLRLILLYLLYNSQTDVEELQKMEQLAQIKDPLNIKAYENIKKRLLKLPHKDTNLLES